MSAEELDENVDRDENITPATAALERYAELGAGWDYESWAREHAAEKSGRALRS